jgi:hypothetical protein
MSVMLKAFSVSSMLGVEMNAPLPMITDVSFLLLGMHSAEQVLARTSPRICIMICRLHVHLVIGIIYRLHLRLVVSCHSAFWWWRYILHQPMAFYCPKDQFESVLYPHNPRSFTTILNFPKALEWFPKWTTMKYDVSYTA